MIAPNVEDISVAEDMLSIKWGNFTNKSCLGINRLTQSVQLQSGTESKVYFTYVSYM